MVEVLERYKRQIDIVNYEELSIPIHLIGCGGIGSWTALTLAKMGCSNIHVYDDDEVEEHNVASQFFSDDQLEMLKTDALAVNVEKFTNMKLHLHINEEEKDINEGLVILAVDSLDARRELSEIFKEKNIFIIDGRMGGLQAEIYCRNSKDYIIGDKEEADHEPCTAKAISFNCEYIGSMIANFVRLYIKGELKGNEDLIYLFDNNMLLKNK